MERFCEGLPSAGPMAFSDDKKLSFYMNRDLGRTQVQGSVLSLTLEGVVCIWTCDDEYGHALPALQLSLFEIKLNGSAGPEEAEMKLHKCRLRKSDAPSRIQKELRTKISESS